jgi:hypothetical protein
MIQKVPVEADLQDQTVAATQACDRGGVTKKHFCTELSPVICLDGA